PAESARTDTKTRRGGTNMHATSPSRHELTPGPGESARPDVGQPKAKTGSAEERAARKVIDRIDRRLTRLAEQEAGLNEQLAEHAQDYERLADLGAQLDVLHREKDELELEWLEAAEAIE
ncbi:MAG: ABC transporter C-terminal domain-containing protein, partial [Nocardioides sp.]|nr:ABC transporter C-terminal domain-containing protein [Nocardioides sp.]